VLDEELAHGATFTNVDMSSVSGLMMSEEGWRLSPP